MDHPTETVQMSKR